MLKLLVRLGFLGLGLFIIYVFGGAAVKTVGYRVGGVTVEGRVVGFVAGRGHGSVQTEGTGVRKGKRRARRPVFRYAPAGTSDSITVRGNTSVLLSFAQYELGERVPVVYDADAPADGYLFGLQIIFVHLLLVLFGLFMLKIAATGRM